ncbi:membrane protein [Actibacterium pelagium]|uniref:Membrane protein n=2 Tax=Actibacterium pelagium TaxID=2029103 RepID=A0A917AM58_9RHOB|nr:prepilin peptidase [Actibacterium pelagium]GGE60210.1 membrane protein [Actibacterium pelagium]
MMTPAEAALWFLPLVFPICLWVAYSDLKYMKIPNKAVLALLAVFAVVGPFVMPLEDYGWRWALAGAILVVGFLLNQIDAMGAGDAKFAAAMAPFFAWSNVIGAFGVFCACLIVTFVAHRLIRRMQAVRTALPNWESLFSKKFPMGIALMSTLLIHLVNTATK